VAGSAEYVGKYACYVKVDDECAYNIEQSLTACELVVCVLMLITEVS